MCDINWLKFYVNVLKSTDNEETPNVETYI